MAGQGERSGNGAARDEARDQRNAPGAEIVPSRIPATSPFHQPRSLTAAERSRFRKTAAESRAAKRAAAAGLGPEPVHEINIPALNPEKLMPQLERRPIRALSLFSGGGGLDLGFDRAGFSHVASFEVLEPAAETIRSARPEWDVRGGRAGNVTAVPWRRWRDDVDVLHGGPPCQPFSIAGRQRGPDDARDLWPTMVECILATRPLAFVGENVPALASSKFHAYVRSNIVEPLSGRYQIRMFTLRSDEFGVPQRRKRVFFVGFARKRDARRFEQPKPTHSWQTDDQLMDDVQRCLGLREALGLPDIGIDDLSPTIRSTLSGPRHTTSILNSVAAQRTFAKLKIWPNGVAASREEARIFVAKNGHFRLSVPDVALIQGFPEDWPFAGATYMKLGQIGNAVPPPLACAVASSVRDALA